MAAHNGIVMSGAGLWPCLVRFVRREVVYSSPRAYRVKVKEVGAECFVRTDAGPDHRPQGTPQVGAIASVWAPCSHGGWGYGVVESEGFRDSVLLREDEGGPVWTVSLNLSGPVIRYDEADPQVFAFELSSFLSGQWCPYLDWLQDRDDVRLNAVRSLAALCGANHGKA